MGAPRDRSQQKAKATQQPRLSTKAGRGRVATTHTDAADQTSSSSRAPKPTVFAGWLGIAEGLAGVLFGVAITVAELSGFEGSLSSSFGYGTAVMFFIIFGFVAIAGWALCTSRPWGRTPVLMLNMFLVPISWYMFSSGRPELAIPTLVIAVAGLGLSFHPQSVEWAATRFGSSR